MKNRPWYLFFLLFWLIPALACGGGSPVVPTATSAAGPKATATSAAAPKATATRASTVKSTATAESESTATAESTSATTGQFDPITFSAGVLNDETAVDPLDTYPDGVTVVYAVYNYSGMQDGESWRTEWKHDGVAQPDLTQEKQWKGGESGSWWVSLLNPKGIKTGEWELDLYVGDNLQQTGKFTVEPNPAGKPDFGPITFAPDKDSQDKPVNALTPSNNTLPKGTALVYAFFDGLQVPKGTTWTSQWFHNGDSASDPKQHTWDFGPSENDWISFGSTDNSPLESGTYELKLNIGSRLVNIGTYIMP
jgi:hypothetical protein